VKFSKNPFRTLYACWFGFWTILSFTLLYPLIRYALSNPKRYPLGHKIRRFWGKVLLVTGFVKVTQEFEEPIDTSKPYVICPNHTSQLDIVTLTVKLNQLDFSFMAKKVLEEIPE
jgi:1-acyl-sn-glycerol-3-phosphate acyltransferase